MNEFRHPEVAEKGVASGRLLQQKMLDDGKLTKVMGNFEIHWPTTKK